MAAKFGLTPGEKQQLRNTIVNSNFKPVVRFGDPNLKFFQEPRAHPKLVETFTAFGIDGSQPNPFAGMQWDDLSSARQMAQNHATMAKLYDMLPNDLAEDDFEPEIGVMSTNSGDIFPQIDSESEPNCDGLFIKDLLQAWLIRHHVQNPANEAHPHWQRVTLSDSEPLSYAKQVLPDHCWCIKS